MLQRVEDCQRPASKSNECGATHASRYTLAHGANDRTQLEQTKYKQGCREGLTRIADDGQTSEARVRTLSNRGSMRPVMRKQEQFNASSLDRGQDQGVTHRFATQTRATNCQALIPVLRPLRRHLKRAFQNKLAVFLRQSRVSTVPKS